MAVLKQFGTNIAEQSSTIGTATYELDGALIGYADFDSQFDLNDTPYYAVKSADESKFEYNRGAVFTPGAPDTLARNVWYSSNANAAVSWDSDDLPLIVYVPTSGELMEAMVTGWYATARSALLSFGLWWKKDGVSAGIHQLQMFDGINDIPVGAVNETTHTVQFYGSSKVTRVQSGAKIAITSAVVPLDNTTPQIGEGAAMSAFDLAFTVQAASSKIRVTGLINISVDGAASHILSPIFIDGGANSVGVAAVYSPAAQTNVPLEYNFEISNPGVGAHTLTFRVGTSSGTPALTINGFNNVAYFNSLFLSHVEVQELFSV